MSKILVGIAGWSYPDWKGLVFPRETQFNKLEYLARYFNTVEINTSFYSIPSLKLVEGWLRSVRSNPEFSFAVKVHKQLTHGEDTQKGQPQIVESTVRAFNEVLEPLRGAGKLGALLLQFPYRFHYTPENRDYLCAVLDVFREYPLVAEVRHRSFAQASFFKSSGVISLYINFGSIHSVTSPKRMATTSLSSNRPRPTMDTVVILSSKSSQ